MKRIKMMCFLLALLGLLSACSGSVKSYAQNCLQAPAE